MPEIKDLQSKPEADLHSGLSGRITERIARLREKVLSTKPTVCTERARFYTIAYQEHEDQPVIIKRALALQKTLEEMTIFMDEGDLIVGNQSSRLRAAPIFPEYAIDWLPREMDELDKRPGDAFFIAEADKQELLRTVRMVERQGIVRQGQGTHVAGTTRPPGCIHHQGNRESHLRRCTYCRGSAQGSWLSV